ncbi:MAG: sulfite exporter TauE/SafE family protein [Gammaproteobacteria bacterium]|nr:sulfite exporter TauE/SafE family protein [Gammaproteobacteria bacterium]
MLSVIGHYPVILLFVYLLIGLLSSFIVTLIGGGGSLIILSGLSFIFLHIFPADIALKLAIGTGIATFPVIAIAAYITLARIGHQKSSRYFIIILPAVLIGAFIGPHIAIGLSSALLHPCIGILLGLLAAYKLFWPGSKNAALEQERPLTLRLGVITFLVALLASVLSIASSISISIFLIPYLSNYVPYRRAVSTNIAAAIPADIIGALIYAVFSGHLSHIGTNWHIGYIYLPAFICIAMMAIVGSVIGGKLTVKLSTERIKKAFYIYVLISGIVIGIKG